MTEIGENLVKARTAFAQRDYATALSYLDRISPGSGCEIEGLLLKARAIQLYDGKPPYTLKAAEECMLRVLKADPRNVQALVDTGFFYSRVLPNKEESEKMFNGAIAILRSHYGEAICGLLELHENHPIVDGSLVEEEIKNLREYIEKEQKREN